MSISLDTKAHYYEKLLKIMATPPKMSDDIHGVYSPGIVKRTTYDGAPFIYLKWTIIPDKMWYTLAVIPCYDNTVIVHGELDFKKTPEVQAWVKRKGDPNIQDQGSIYEWKVRGTQASDWFNDVRLQYPNRDIPTDLLNQAAMTLKEKFGTFCQGWSNPYFDLYSMLK